MGDEFSENELNWLEQVAPEFIQRRSDGSRYVLESRAELWELACRFPSMMRGVFAEPQRVEVPKTPEERVLAARYPTMSKR